MNKNNFNNFNNINEPSQETMNALRNQLKSMSKFQRKTVESIKKIPPAQKIIIVVLISSGILLFVKYIFNRVKEHNIYNPHYLPTINNMSVANNVFNGSIVSNGCSLNTKDDCVINQDYTNSGCCKINKSNFKETYDGLFTYSFWLNVASFNPGLSSNTVNQNLYKNDQWKHILHRGNGTISNDENGTKIQYPGVWLNPNMDTIVFDFNNGGQNVSERMEIKLEKYNTWVNYSVVLNRNIVSIYVDGKLVQTIMLKQKYITTKNFNLYLGSQGLSGNGFPGYLAYLTYFNKVYDAEDIYKLHLYYKNKMKRYIKLEKNYLLNNVTNPTLIKPKK